MNKPNYTPALLFVGTSILVLAIALIFNNDKTIDAPIENDSDVEVEIEAPVEVETQEVKASNHKNEDLGFSFDYPETWTATNDKQGRDFVTVTAPGNNIQSDERLIVIDMRFERVGDELPETFYEYNTATDNITIDGEQGTVYISQPGLGGMVSTVIIIEHYGVLYQLDFDVTDGKEFPNVIKQVKDSFTWL